jgi:hypothetical protein
MVLVLCGLHKAKGDLVLVVLVKELLCEQFSLDNTLYFGDQAVKFALLADLTHLMHAKSRLISLMKLPNKA